MIKILLFTTLFVINSFSFSIDKELKFPKNKTFLKSGKKDSSRLYELEKELTLKAPLAKVISSILMYDQKCNSEYKDKRVLTPKDKKCKYHNKNLIETKVHTMMDNKKEKFFVLERRVYNREVFANVDMVTLKTQTNGQVTISQRMLTDVEAKRYIKNPIKRNSVFTNTSANYTLTPQKGAVKVQYNYKMITDHWILNKSMAASRVFDSMKTGTDLLFKSIEQELKPKPESEEVTAAL